MKKQDALDTVVELQNFLTEELPSISKFPRKCGDDLASHLIRVTEAIRQDSGDKDEIMKIFVGISANLMEIFGFPGEHVAMDRYSLMYKSIMSYLDTEVY